jgi:hypothetical protein
MLLVSTPERLVFMICFFSLADITFRETHSILLLNTIAPLQGSYPRRCELRNHDGGEG